MGVEKKMRRRNKKEKRKQRGGGEKLCETISINKKGKNE